MKVFLNPLLRAVFFLALKSGLFTGIKPRLKALLEGTAPLSSVIGYRSFGTFKDSGGNEHNLIEGLRDAIKPNWRSVFKPQDKLSQSPRELRQSIKWAGDSVGKALAFLKCFGFHLEGKTVLEVGCHGGLKTYAFAAAGAGSVTGSDITEYYSVIGYGESGGEVGDQLAQIRTKVAGAVFGKELLGSPAERVEFREDDISASALPSGHFDLVCSWEVFEHVLEPSLAFRQIHRILKPGGIAFHEYNPFYSLGGGHSPCTLDFLWGHAVLSAEDFKRYVSEFRPKEVKMAVDFFTQSLNRMTLAELGKFSRESGLETLVLIPWPERSHLELLKPETVRLCRAMNPTVEIDDLISPFVWVVQRKPHAEDPDLH